MIRPATAIPAIALVLALSACAQPATPVYPSAVPGGPPVTAAPTDAPTGPMSTAGTVPQGRSPLNGTEWTLGAVLTRKKVTFPVEGAKAVIDIGDGQFKGTTGCNTFLGKVTLTEAGQWTVNLLQAGKDSCANPALAEQNQSMLAILKDASSYLIEGSVLTLTAAADASSLKFARV